MRKAAQQVLDVGGAQHPPYTWRAAGAEMSGARIHRGEMRIKQRWLPCDHAHIPAVHPPTIQSKLSHCYPLPSSLQPHTLPDYVPSHAELAHDPYAPESSTSSVPPMTVLSSVHPLRP